MRGEIIKVGRNTRLRLLFSPTLLSCSSRFLRALQPNIAQSRLLYLLKKRTLRAVLIFVLEYISADCEHEINPN